MINVLTYGDEKKCFVGEYNNNTLYILNKKYIKNVWEFNKNHIKNTDNLIVSNFFVDCLIDFIEKYHINKVIIYNNVLTVDQTCLFLESFKNNKTVHSLYIGLPLKRLYIDDDYDLNCERICNTLHEYVLNNNFYLLYLVILEVRYNNLNYDENITKTLLL